MLDSVRNYVSSHVSSQADASNLVRDARRFSMQIPLVGKVSVPPPDHLAFYGVLAVLGVTELIPWPVALGLGVGHALTSRHPAETAEEIPAETSAAPARKAPAKKASGKAPAKKTPAKKVPAKKASPRTVAKKTPAKAAKTSKAVKRR